LTHYFNFTASFICFFIFFCIFGLFESSAVGENIDMSRARVTSSDNRLIEIEYDTFGSPSDPALLLIMGFTAQMVAWEEEFCKMFSDRGFHVIRFDNRDCGLSTHLDGVAVDTNAVIEAAMFETEMPAVPYTLSDMASDAVGLLDHLKISKAHILGASMGGMIAQTFAIDHPHRTLSLISVMSQPGEPEVGQPSPEAAIAIMAQPPKTREEYIESSTQWQVWQSKKYRSDEISFRNAARDFDRAFYPEGAPRQMAAIYASGRRTEQLAKLTCPTLVVHGLDDTLISPSGGERTAELIPSAKLLMVKDMGHDLPRPLWPAFVDAVVGHIAQVVA
jgi:pimeloyl-ACP methyl ester carboxylesterase